MDLYKIFMLVAVPALGIGWYLYYRWNKKLEEERKNRPKPISKQLQKTKSEVSDWAQKMANFESPAEQARKRKLELERKLEEQERQRQQEQKD